MSTPYIGFSNETLGKLPRVHAGDFVTCDKCHGQHQLKAPDSGGELLLFYNCCDKLYLGAVFWSACDRRRG